MAKIVKRKKKKSLKFYSFSVALLLFSAVCYLSSCLFLRSYNNSLSTQKQSIDAEIAVLETENDAITVEIQTLSARERVNTIASDSGLSLNQDNIVTITAAVNDSGE